ncbi:pseudoazurin [Falsigemmobacter faecalis]|nr:pseudoazurin [Falsigemmobacter faecalis]
MLNRSDTGSMIYEPDFLRIAPGDTVVFRVTHPSHNAATIAGMIPNGAAKLLGKIDQEIEMTLNVPGTYGIKCSPHFSMGMVMMIEVGDGEPDVAALPADLPPMAAERFRAIIGRAVQ